MTFAVPTVTLRRARPADADGYAALMNDPLVYPGVLQLPYTDADFWRTRLAEPGGAAVADLSLVAVAEATSAVGATGASALPK